MKCKALSARPMEQQMADVPEIRSVTGKVFENTGTDCFGPFTVRVGRSDHKRWGVLFTCMVTRAVHIEIVTTMETTSYVNALRRFICRRGPVKTILSDNGTNLVGAEKLLRSELAKLDNISITKNMQERGIEWRFNPPHASHFGGVWERQIRTVRRVLNGLISQRTLSDEVLSTLMCEVEAIVNGRPLTRVSSDPRDMSPLSPSMLLTLADSPGPITVTERNDIFRARWRQVQLLADIFWKRWSAEYLSELQVRQKWNTKRRELKIGDIVLSLDEKLPRGSWPMGRVTEVLRSADGRVRKARLKTEHGEYLRPIAKMCLLLEGEIN